MNSLIKQKPKQKKDLPKQRNSEKKWQVKLLTSLTILPKT